MGAGPDCEDLGGGLWEVGPGGGGSCLGRAGGQWDISLSVGDTVIRSKLRNPGSQPRLHPTPVTSGPGGTPIGIQRVAGAAGEAWPGGSRLGVGSGARVRGSQAGHADGLSPGLAGAWERGDPFKSRFRGTSSGSRPRVPWQSPRGVI